MLFYKKLLIPDFKAMNIFVAFNLLFIFFGHSAMCQCDCPLHDGDFEEDQKAYINRSKWIREGSAGIDFKAGTSFRGYNNAWVKADKGWNAIRRAVLLSQEYTYVLEVFIKTSENVRDGYFGFWDAQQHPVSEIKFGQSSVYRKLTVKFKPPKTGRYYIFAGVWAPAQPAWIKVDDFSMTCPCPDVNAIPVDN